MRIDILTLFPNSFSAFDESIIKRAKDKGLVDINLHNFREYSNCPHKKVDDYIFGGGAGMLLACQPIVDCIKKVDPNNSAYRIFLSPK
ncbi:MAG: tRNA (guanosine(37)-N1)-methyltransferase TrmD, partial [Firmicutes bacterium]|nr:tRNA (guanosine(37)-N1)-methyltransferase TrmD [Bacillota bacterium]